MNIIIFIKKEKFTNCTQIIRVMYVLFVIINMQITQKL